MIKLSIDLKYCIMICLYVVCTTIAIVVMPGANVVRDLVGFVSVTSCVTLVYRQLRSHSSAGEFGLFAASLLMTVGLVANIYYFTTFSGGTCEAPVLQNNDSNYLWSVCNSHYYEGGVIDAYQRGFYGSLNALLMKIFGHSIVVLLIANMFMMQSSLVLCSLITYNITTDKRTAGYALCAAAAVCYLLTMGTVLLRDAWVIFGIALAAYGLTSPRKYGWIATMIGALLVSAIRTHWAWTIAIGAVLMLFDGERSKQRCLQTALIVVFVALVWYVPEHLNLTPAVSNSFQSEALNKYYHFNHQQQQAYYGLFGNYFDFTLYKKLLFLPATIVVQFLIPFPWNYMRDVIFGYSQVYAHISYMWYAFAGAVLYFLCFVRSKHSRRLMLFTIWAVISWAVPCFLYGGMVSRYGLTSVLLLAPSVGVVLSQHLRTRTFVRYIICYAVALAIVLPICYVLQTQSTL